MKLWSTVEPALCFRHDDIPEGKYEFLLKSIERDRTKWICTYIARDKEGKPCADLQLFIGALKIGSKKCGVKALVRPFPRNQRGILPHKYRRAYLAQKRKLNGKFDM